MKMFQAIVEQSTIGVAVFREGTGDCMFLNKMAQDILEIPKSLRAEPNRPKLHLSQLYTDVIRSGARPFNAEVFLNEGLPQDVLMRRMDGAHFLANIVAQKLLSAEYGPVLLLTFQDITFQKKLQRELTLKQEEIRNAYAELLEQNNQLKQLDLAKDKFVALITHELRTPLSAIVATTEVLKLRLYDNAEQARHLINTLHEEGLHLMALVNDILDHAKIQAGKMDFYLEHLSLAPLIRKVCESHANMADQYAVSIHFENLNIEAQAYFDSFRLRQVLSNVVNNAIKYNKASGKVWVSIVDSPAYWRISVRDSGQGIPIDKIPQVFHEFETLGSVAKHHKGTGLGMAISKRLLAGMGGTISLQSQEGTGSEFFIDVPKEKNMPQELYRRRPDSWEDLAA